MGVVSLHAAEDSNMGRPSFVQLEHYDSRFAKGETI